MGKHQRGKQQFMDRNKAVVFNLITNEQGEKIFQMVSMPKGQTLSEDEQKMRDKIIDTFSPDYEKALEEEKAKIMEQKMKLQQEFQRDLLPPEVLAQLQDKDLWMKQIQNLKPVEGEDVENQDGDIDFDQMEYDLQEIQQEDVEDGFYPQQQNEYPEYDDEDYNEQQQDDESGQKSGNKANKQSKGGFQINSKDFQGLQTIEREGDEDNEDDWSSEDEEGGEQIQEEEEEQFKEIKKPKLSVTKQQEKQKEIKKVVNQVNIKYVSSDALKQEKQQEQILQKVDGGAFVAMTEQEKKKMLLEEVIVPDYSKIKLSSSVRMKMFDEYGLPVNDGHDYHMHIAQENTDGVLVSRIMANYQLPPILEPDIDYKPQEMTKEQKEVFEALEFQGDADAYQELEDDFLDILQGGQKVIIEQPKYQKQEVKIEKPAVEQKKQVKFSEKLEIGPTAKVNQQEFNKQPEPIIKKTSQNDIPSTSLTQLEQSKAEKQSQQDEKKQKQNEEKSKKLAQMDFDPNDYDDGGFQDIQQQHNLNKVQIIKDQDLDQAEDQFDQISDGSSDGDFDINDKQIKQPVGGYKSDGKKLTKDQFEDILDTHLTSMKGNDKLNTLFETQQFQEKGFFSSSNHTVIEKDLAQKSRQMSDSESEEEQGEKRLTRKQRKIKLMQERYQKEKEEYLAKKGLLNLDGFKPEEIFVGTTYQYNIDEDEALKTYLQQDTDDEGSDGLFQSSSESDNETIVTQNFSVSMVHENLNIIDQSKQKKKSDNENDKSKLSIKSQTDAQSVTKDSQNLAEDDDNDDEENDVQINQVFLKRSQNQTKEEKEARKKLIQQFKAQRKEQQKVFQESLDSLQQDQVTKINKQTHSQTMNGASIIKIN